jgi:hypothetical protein
MIGSRSSRSDTMWWAELKGPLTRTDMLLCSLGENFAEGSRGAVAIYNVSWGVYAQWLQLFAL